jgi:small conductance mechanosensitive channel
MRAWLSIDTPPVELAQSVGPAQDTPPADGDGQLLRDVEPLDLSDLTDPGTVLDVLVGALENLITGFVARVPLLVLAAVILVIALLLIRVIMRLVDRGLNRERVEFAVQRLISNLLRVSLVTGAVLLALSIAGVQVGAALAAIGLVGLALAFALQNILENFVAGMLILVRKPFGRGDQIETNDYCGTVEDVDLRVTRLRVFDGELVLVPNADVFTHPIVNLTTRGPRRTRVLVGIDYRDDHDAAVEVLREAVAVAPGVLKTPAPEVLVVELGDSSVDFEVAYWSAPDMRSVRHTRDEVLRGCKRAVEGAGMRIPWPIRTLAADRQELRVHAEVGRWEGQRRLQDRGAHDDDSERT